MQSEATKNLREYTVETLPEGGNRVTRTRRCDSAEEARPKNERWDTDLPARSGDNTRHD